MFKLGDQPYFYGLLVLLVWAPLPLASNRVWAAMLLSVAVLILLFFWLLGLLKGYFSIPQSALKAKPALLALLLLQAWTLLQCLPFPFAFLGLEATNLYGAAGVSLHSISVSPGYSFYAFLVGLSYCSGFVLVLLLVNSTQRIKVFMYTVILSGVFQAVFGSYMVLSGTEYLFLIEKWAGSGTATGTFVNRNHLAAYLGIALSFGVGLLLAEWAKSDKEKTKREVARDVIQLVLGEKARLRLFLAVMVIGLVMTHSRMGNMAFVSSLLITGAVFAYKSKRLNIKVILFFASILLVDAVIIGNWFGLERLVDRIQATEIESEQRVELNFGTVPMLGDFAVLGSGAYTMPQLIPAYLLEQAPLPYEHVHNDYVELLVTLGVLGSAVLFLALLFIVKQLFTRKKFPYPVFMMICYLLLHSFTDFNLFIPAIAFTVCACLALVYCEPHKNSRKTKKYSENDYAAP